MKSYKIQTSRQVEKELKQIEPRARSAIKEAVLSLANNPRPAGINKLKGHDSLFRLRVGDYRIIYTVEDTILVVLIIKIGHRKEIYKKI